MSQGGHSEPLLFLALFYQSTPSCLKVRGGKLECAGGHVELPLVLDLAVHLVVRWVKGTILRHLCHWHFFTRVLLHA